MMPVRTTEIARPWLGGFWLILFAFCLELPVGCGRSAPVSPVSLQGAPRRIVDESAASACRIEFTLGEPGSVTLRILDATGRQVRTIAVSLSTPGVNELSWDGNADSGLRVGGGVYFYEIDFSDGERLFGRVVLVR